MKNAKEDNFKNYVNKIIINFIKKELIKFNYKIINEQTVKDITSKFGIYEESAPIDYVECYKIVNNDYSSMTEPFIYDDLNICYQIENSEQNKFIKCLSFHNVKKDQEYCIYKKIIKVMCPINEILLTNDGILHTKKLFIMTLSS